ncbi:uncharacterized protein [Lolium perenne]|uniref:uncharacterized protein n=1 Tax=Lolium perenne TaxID=4522 RepID=UPI003A9A1A96
MARLTVDQRARLALTNLRSMMMIPSVKMRTILIRFMLDVFDPATGTFEIGDNNGAVSLGFVDVECLLGLVNEGFSAGEILTEEGEDVKHRIPPQFISKSTGNIVIDELIDDIIKSKLADDDFLRRYLYWEKCQPLEGDCAFNPKLSMRPLMRNWNEAAATRRDNFDYEHGRGRGNVKIDENITEEYRMMEPVVPDPVAAHQNNAKPASAVPKKKQAPKPIDNGQTEILINRLTGYLDAQLQKMLATIPALCAQRTLEMFNKEGVTYKPAAAPVSGNMEDQEDVNSFRNGPRDKKEFMYKEESDSAGGGDSIRIIDMNLADEVDKLEKRLKEPAKNGTAKNANDAMRTPDKAGGLNGTPAGKPFGDVGSTPDNPFIIENADPVTSDSEIDLDAVSISKFLSKSKEDELAGKRKRTIPKKFQSPYALDRRTKRQVRGSSTKALNFDDKSGADKNAKPDASCDLTAELVDAAIVFLELASRSDQHKKKNVYRSARGDEVNAERLRVVLDEKWLSDDVIDGYIGHLNLRVGDDRFLCPAWRSKYLVDRAIAGDKPKESSKNMDSAMVYFPLNIGNTHWTTVVMHIPKQEFQVLDSLYPLEFTLETVEALRRQIADDMQVANEVTSGNHPDVSKWPILEYDMPQQHDGNSCGLFVMECMEHWDGDRMTTEISQIKINGRRRRIVAEMMLSPSNTLEMVKERIRSVASRINKKT